MEFSPLVSVVVPNYNHGAYLVRRIESILEQTFDNIEVIILDDCSDDNSIDIIKKYASHPKVSQVRLNDENSGSPFRQWKRGVDLAKGKLVWIAESDDTCSKEFLHTLVQYFKNDDIVLAYSNCNIIDENDEVIMTSNNWVEAFRSEKWKRDHVEFGMELLKNYQRYRNVISNASGVLFRKNVWDRLEIPSGFRYTGDWFIWNSICAEGKVAYCASSLNNWRTHEDTTRKIDVLEKEYDRLKENKRTIDVVNQLIPSGKNIEKKHYYWLLAWWMSRFSFRNCLKVKYIFPHLPNILLFDFYKRLIARFFMEVYKSIKKKVLYVKQN